MALTFSPEGPYPLVTLAKPNLEFHDGDTVAQWFSTEIACMHNVIIRGLNSIWLNAPLVPPSDTKDFIGYGLACTSLIRAHHKTQEQVIFPRLQEKIDMRTNVVEHLAFEKQLKELEAYLHMVHGGFEHFEYEKLLELRAALGGVLVQHLHDEIHSVSPERLSAFSAEELKAIVEAIDEHEKDFRDSATLFTYIVTHHRKEDAPGWPIAPTSVKWFTNHVGIHLHHQYWKFSPFTVTGDFQVYGSHLD